MLVYLCDLAHTTQGYNSELVPYAIGCIGSYLRHWGEIDVKVRLFKDPHILDEAFKIAVPDVVGFSHYMWNANLGLRYAAAIKESYPCVLTVFGGPHFPLDRDRQAAYLRLHPEIDVFLMGEGEEPFLHLVRICQGRSIREVKNCNIPGLCADIKGVYRVVHVNPDKPDFQPRLTAIESIPSPYLDGSLDAFLADPQLVPLMETNRGCPFSCTFCVDGIASRRMITRFSLGRLADELRYIAVRTRVPSLFLADTNFGMYKQDEEFGEVIRQVQEETGYPQYIVASTGKNNKARVLNIAQMTDGALRVAASVQSLDADVLQQIQRTNISTKELSDMALAVQGTDTYSYSEMILGLPGDTRQKHIDGVCALADMGFDQIRMHQLTLLPGSEMDTSRLRLEHTFLSAYRILQRSFGRYFFQQEEIDAVEIEEVVVGHQTFTLADYLYCRVFALTVALFYNERIFSELIGFFKLKGVAYSGFLRYLYDQLLSRENINVVIQGVYLDFQRQVGNELYFSEASLRQSLISDLDGMEALVAGDRGGNLLLNTQGIVLFRHFEELNQTAMNMAQEFFLNQGQDWTTLDQAYWEELYRYLCLKKGHLSDLEKVEEATFTFDFVALEDSNFSTVPQPCAPHRLIFSYDDGQKAFLRKQMAIFGTHSSGLGKMIARTPMKHTYRKVNRG